MKPSTSQVEPAWPRSEPAALNPGPEQLELRDAIRALLGKHGGVEQARSASHTTEGYSPELWKQLLENMSVTSLAAPEDRGGLGYGMVELGIILEECGRSLVCEPVYSSAVLGVQAVLAATYPVDELLVDVLAGSAVASLSSLTAATDRLSGVESESGWVLSGEVSAVVGGAAADIVIASADTAAGRQIFAIETDGQAHWREREVVDPTRRQADLTVAEVPAVPLVGADDCARICTRLHDLRTLAIAFENTGIVDALLEMTVEYVKTRQQFGRPIGSFQAVKHRLADVLVLLERARSASRYAAAIFDEDPDTARLAIAVAGAVCTDAAIDAAAEAVQLHGGVGFTWEHPAHSYFRRALGNEAVQGDSRTHRARIAELIGV
ncbi:acyl-CoA dehydrogenase family protein [Rhodococcus sp. ARC_M6]|uniref:acyl-CoA dehydrogenase family protein n=1 Tax=Rhodococcus sp. ARC_M6 TaxID=2928852 RepID=UPI001FB3CD62|nr:acyl-CoA dehydrogenase family protein [Rhodococcus sp. ARC_M6]MCJ0906762.1 acyl-CoA/acyl-ACP dehydrogenase [Rhodococcus sp. ARC_M6]